MTDHEKTFYRGTDHQRPKVGRCWCKSVQSDPGPQYQRINFYRWKSKYGGMEVSDAKKLRQIEEENRRLKELVANLTLDNHILKDIIEKTYKACRQAARSYSSAKGI